MIQGLGLRILSNHGPFVSHHWNERAWESTYLILKVASFLAGLAEVRYVESPSTIEVICNNANRNFARDSIILLGIDEKTPRIASTGAILGQFYPQGENLVLNYSTTCSQNNISIPRQIK